MNPSTCAVTHKAKLNTGQASCSKAAHGASGWYVSCPRTFTTFNQSPLILCYFEHSVEREDEDPWCSAGLVIIELMNQECCRKTAVRDSHLYVELRSCPDDLPLAPATSGCETSCQSSPASPSPLTGLFMQVSPKSSLSTLSLTAGLHWSTSLLQQTHVSLNAKER
ncbi:hypothetical protein OJAV_G00021990 [Oryzias javanicus]|uniref:Uncharacterized protein n=1 Tax=Oryzias javanicus TaxID=123683 RepID=A0A3S2UMT3_ORYJA|nr:hypothetical protein OJAV_G00021990 [Oryzias javanicus]